MNKGRKKFILSDREKEVLGWRDAGVSVSEIARILNLSRGTISVYLKRAYEKRKATQ